MWWRGARVASWMAPPVIVALAVVMGCGPAERDVTRGTLRVAGSDAALRLMRAEADTFVAYYKKATIAVEGGGTVVGLEALINRETDLAVLSREPSAEERAAADSVGVEVYLYKFALDGLAIIVRRDNMVYALGFDEVRRIFSGEVDDWADLGGKPGGIRVVATGVQTGATSFVRRELLGGAPFAAGVERAPTTRAVDDSVAAHEGAIGYASMAELDDRVKALPISPPGGGPLVALSFETVHKQQYPLIRTFYFGTRGIPTDDLVSGFVSFVTSTRGQRIVYESGFVPATVPLRIKHEGSPSNR